MMAITKCLIWVPPVNQFTVVPMVLSSVASASMGVSPDLETTGD